MKLQLHLIPSSSFCSNLRSKVPAQWDSISKTIRQYHNNTCEICSWKQNPNKKLFTHAHEVWSFDESTHIQSLSAIECVCPSCHQVHHWGKSQVDNLNMNYLMNHACKVNSCSRNDFEKYIKSSFTEWERRSDITWTLDINNLEEILSKHKPTL